MRILFLGRNDWANVSNRVARAMNTAAETTVARVLTEQAHPFGYHEDMVVTKRTHQRLFEWAAEANWIISTGDGDYEFFFSMLSFLPKRRDVKLATAHVGSMYRRQAAEYNQIDAARFAVRFIGADLYRLCENDPKAVPYFAPPDTIVTSLPPIANGRPRIGHSPTARVNKGTDNILSVLSKLKVDLDLIEGVSYTECVTRRARCHIFIDQMEPSIGGFGASAVEAMAAGCVVLADIRNVVEGCYRFFPRPPIIDVRTASDLEREIAVLLEDPAVLEARRRASLAWAQEYACASAIARYWTSPLSLLSPL